MTIFFILSINAIFCISYWFIKIFYYQDKINEYEERIKNNDSKYYF